MSTPSQPVEIVHPYIECVVGVQGGRPVIKGTRFPVNSIVQNHRRGLSVDEMLREFPHLTPAQIHDALSYYYDHRQQIDAEIQELADVKKSIDNFPPTLNPANRPEQL